MNIGRCLRNLQSCISVLKCEGGCPDLPIKSRQIFDAPDMNSIVSSWRDTRRYPVAVFDQADASNAQRFMRTLKLLPNPWVFASTGNEYGPGLLERGCDYCPVEMLIDHPLMIYSSLMSSKRKGLCLFRFTSYLSCTIERGCLANLYQYFREEMPSTGSIKLLGPRGVEGNLSWERLQPEVSQEMWAELRYAHDRKFLILLRTMISNDT